MTFPPNYVKEMAASPIQREWKPQVGNWYIDIMGSKITEPILLTQDYFPFTPLHNDRINTIWLPTSDDWWERIDLKPDISLLFGRGPLDYFHLQVFNEWDISKIFYAQTKLELLSALVHWQRWGLRWEGERWMK